MKRIPILTLITLLAVTAIAAPGPGRGPRAGDGPAPNHGPAGEILPPPLLADFLDLTESQIASAETLRTTMRNTIEPLRDQLQANREQIRDAVEAGNAAQAGGLLVANHAIAQQIRTAHETFTTAFAALLTPAQKAKWDVYQEIVELRRDRERPD